jgi:hypothetical protein
VPDIDKVEDYSINQKLMDEISKPQIEAIILLNSNLWKMTDNATLKKKLEDMNNYLRGIN